MKKKLALLLACIMMLATVLPMSVLAASGKTGNGTNTVYLHKILMDDTAFKNFTVGTVGRDKTKYNGNKIDDINKFFVGSEGGSAKEIPDVYFVWKYNDGVNKGKYVTVIGSQVGVADSIDAPGVLGGLTSDLSPEGFTAIKFDVSKLPAGKYLIDEVHEKSTYQGEYGENLEKTKAVPVDIELPMKNESGTMETVHVYPKNTENKPKMDKNFLKGKAKEAGVTVDQLLKESGNKYGDFDKAEDALGADYEKYTKKKATVEATVGTAIPYEVKTLVPANAQYKTFIWRDVMTKGLTYNADSLIITGTTVGSPQTPVTFSAGDYTLTESKSGFKLELNKSGLDKINGQEKEIEIRLTYKATVNSSAVVDKPDTNDITLEYGKKGSSEGTPVGKKGPKIDITKTWASGTAPEEVTVQYDLWDGIPWGPNSKIIATSPKLEGPNFNFTFGKDVKDTANSMKVEEMTDKGMYYVTERYNGYKPEYQAGADTALTVRNTKNNDHINPTEPKVVTYGKKFVKKDANKDDDRLMGAEFYVRDGKGASAKYLHKKSLADLAADQSAYDTAKAAYQKAVDKANAILKEGDSAKPADKNLLNFLLGKSSEGATGEFTKNIDTLRIESEQAFKKARYAYEWKSEVDDANVVKLISDSQGRFEITGLNKGTYYLEEIKAPQGYAKPSNLLEFVVGPGTYQGTSSEVSYNKDKTDAGYGQAVPNNQVTIPRTGGIGTIIFTVAGLAIMGTAAMSLIRRKEATN